MLVSIRGVMRGKKALFYLACAQLKFCVQFQSLYFKKNLEEGSNQDQCLLRRY